VNKALLGLLFLLLLQPVHAKWVFISKDNLGNSYFYEDTKVVKDPSAEEVSTWQMISYVDRMNAPNGESIYSVLQDISYFCALVMKVSSSFILVITLVLMAAVLRFKV